MTDEDPSAAFHWLDPWDAVEGPSPGSGPGLEEILAREVAPGHPLHGVPVRAIARSYAADDVLFRLLDGTGRVAEAPYLDPLAPDRPPWPLSGIFADLETWAEQRMRPDHEGYLPDA